MERSAWAPGANSQAAFPARRDRTLAARALLANIPRQLAPLRAREEPAPNELRVPNGCLLVLYRASAKRMSGLRLTGLSSMATRHILAELARDYEESRGAHVEIRSMGGVEAAKLVRAGEATDVVVLASKVMASFEAEGHLAKGGTKDFARSEIGVAVRAGVALPSVADEQAVKQAIWNATNHLLLDWPERRSLEGAVPEMGRAARRGRSWRRRVCRWRRWSRMATLISGFSNSAS